MERLALEDGTELVVRTIEAADAGRLVRFHSRLSDETVYLRFFAAHPELRPEEVDRFTQVDHERREAVVALLGDDIVAVARFDRLGDGTDAEVAFVVADELQGKGIATALLGELARRAVVLGVQRLVAETLPHNHRMLAVFRNAGLPFQSRFVDGTVHVVLDL
jgi:RimJ/RimL family protein N-acetyltransferase